MSVQSVHRAIDILNLFSPSRPRLGVTEISRLLSLSKPTVHGLVRTLVERGFMQQDPETRKYMLGLNLYEVGAILSGTLKINQVGAGPAHQLAKDTHTTGRLAIRDQNTVLVTLTLYPQYESVFFQLLGPRVPAYCSSIGKAVLSGFTDEELEEYLEGTAFVPLTPYTITDKARLRREIEQIRQRGYAQDNQEHLIGLYCIGAPIYDSQQRVSASLSLSGRPELFSDETIPEMAQKLIQTAAEISRGMGYAPHALWSAKR